MKRVTRRKSRDSVRALIERINSDPVERSKFLLEPSESLSKVGITLSTKASKELQVMIREYLRTYPEIALLPTGLARTRLLSKYKSKGGARRGGGETAKGCFEVNFV